jgi:hypothetical protein
MAVTAYSASVPLTEEALVAAIQTIGQDKALRLVVGPDMRDRLRARRLCSSGGVRPVGPTHDEAGNWLDPEMVPVEPPFPMEIEVDDDATGWRVEAVA